MRRRGRWGAAGTAMAVVGALAALAGCGGSSGGGGGGGGASGGTLIVGRTADIDTLDPHAATAFQTVQSLGLIYGTLTQVDPSMKVVPGLATKWTYSNGNKTLTFDLRKGVTFQNGDTFDSSDVKATFARLLNPKTAAVAASNLASIKRVHTRDASTVVLDLKAPDATLPASLASVNASILSSKDVASKSFLKHPDGTGPFRFGKWVPNQSLTLTRNTSWWAGKVPLESVSFRIIPNEKSVVSAVQSGNVQLGLLSDPLVAKTVSSGGGMQLIKQPSINYHVFMLNARKPPLNDLKVRQAISCAIDRKGVLDSAALGEGKLTGPITIPAYAADPAAGPCPARDVAKAKQLLASSGHGSPMTLKTIVETGEYSTAVAEAQAIQSQLKDVGINLKLQVTDAGPYVKQWLAEDFDAAVALNGGTADPGTMYGRFFSPGGSLVKQGFTSPQLTKLLAQGQQQTDPAARKPIYAKFDAALQQLAPWDWLFTSDDYYVASSSVKGFKPMPNASLQYLATTSLGG